MASSPEHARQWQEFVAIHPEATSYHRWAWHQVVQDSFGWPTHYLMAGQAGQVQGILPLVWQKSWLFGNFLTSMPFLNGGGVVADSREAEEALVREAIALAQRLGAQHLELRHRRTHGLDLPSKTTKVAAARPVERDADSMLATLQHKVRTDIRKSAQSGATAEFGGVELLDEFYQVFAENMRELGTPVLSRAFFSNVLRGFPDDTYVCIVRYRGTAIAASFLLGYRGTLEAAWSASRYAYLKLKPNMLLYWKILCFAGDKGYSTFDFGRSTLGSGTHRFKRQWGTQDVPLHWDYWLREGNKLPQLNPENPRYRAAIWLWQRLPLALTKLLGPRIVRYLP